MALINRPMYEQFGARHLAVKGPGAMTQLEEGVMGVLPLDLMSDPVYWYVQGIKIFAARQSKTGSGSNYSKIGLSLEDANPQSPTIVKILGMWLEDPSATSRIDFYRLARTAFSSDPGIYGYSPDTRVPEAQHSNAVMISAVDTAAAGQKLGVTVAGMDHLFPVEFPMIISPGQAIYALNLTAGGNLAMTWIWAEIPAYKAEL